MFNNKVHFFADRTFSCHTTEHIKQNNFWYGYVLLNWNVLHHPKPMKPHLLLFILWVPLFFHEGIKIFTENDNFQLWLVPCMNNRATDAKNVFYHVLQPILNQIAMMPFFTQSMFGWNESVFFFLLSRVAFHIVCRGVDLVRGFGFGFGFNERKSLEQNFQWLIQWSHPIWYPTHACSSATYSTMRREKNQLKSWEISKMKKFFCMKNFDKRNRKKAQRRTIDNRKTLKNNAKRKPWRMCVHSINITISLCHKQIGDCLLMSLFKLSSSWYAARQHWLMFSNRIHIFAIRLFVCTKRKDCRFFVPRHVSVINHSNGFCIKINFFENFLSLTNRTF